MKIYTKTGDKGTTSLFGGKRVPKHHLGVDAYGTVDELNSYLGLLRDSINDTVVRERLLRIQKELFVLGGVLATPPKKESKKKESLLVNLKMIKLLEEEIDEMDELLPKMTHFILPGGHTTVSYCHIARNVCRRAERISVQLAEKSEVSEFVLGYLNRLSDYLFVLARKLSKDLQAKEVLWLP